MSEKRHELYLIALALFISAGLILYIALDSPAMNAVEAPKNRSAQQTIIYTPPDPSQTSTESTQSSSDLYQSETVPAFSATNQTTQNSAPAATQTEPATPQPSGPININTATKEQLMTLNGIGEVKSAAIIDYRRENGNFNSVDELDNVKGIGPKIIEKIRAFITV
ncbi:MAG: ComEA family DNA-binding protein [Eubacteriales bacterium]